MYRKLFVISLMVVLFGFGFTRCGGPNATDIEATRTSLGKSIEATSAVRLATEQAQWTPVPTVDAPELQQNCVFLLEKGVKYQTAFGVVWFDLVSEGTWLYGVDNAVFMLSHDESEGRVIQQIGGDVVLNEVFTTSFSPDLNGQKLFEYTVSGSMTIYPICPPDSTPTPLNQG